MITLFELGCFGNRLIPSFSFVVQSPNLKCSLAQNLSEALNFDDVITITCDVMKQFLVFLEDFRNFLLSDFGEIWCMGQLETTFAVS